MEKKARISALDGLRGIACIIILLHHFNQYIEMNGFTIIQYGRYCVELFMMLSGFLMAYNYKYQLIHQNFENYFKRKYMTLMPLYWLTNLCMHVLFLLATIMAGKTVYRSDYSLLQAGLEFTGILNGWTAMLVSPLNGPLWMITGLLICYVLYYFLCRLLKRHGELYRFTSVTILVISMTVQTGVVKNSILNFYNMDIYRCISAFFMGVIIYEIYEKFSPKIVKLFSMLGLSIIIIFVLMNRVGIELFPITKDISLLFILLIWPIVICVVIYFKPIKKIMSCGLVLYIGKISMSIYMWHQVIRVFMGSRLFNISHDTLFGTCVLIAVSIVMGSISNYWIEPFIKSRD